jgi:hypothetical protein
LIQLPQDEENDDAAEVTWGMITTVTQWWLEYSEGTHRGSATYKRFFSI